MRTRTHGINLELALASALVLAGTPACTQRESAPERPGFHLVESVRFPSQPDAPLSSVEDIAPAEDGGVFVLDRETPAVLSFSGEGEFRKKLGSEGEGPGEFQRLFSIGVVGDTVWAADEGSDRITLFDLRGTVLETLSSLKNIGLPDDLQAPLPLAYLRDRTILAAAVRDNTLERLQLIGVEVGASRITRLARVNASDRQWVIVIPDVFSSSGQHQPFGSFDLLSWWSEGSSAVVVERPWPESAHRGEYLVRMIKSDGQARRSISVEYDPVPLTDSDVDALIDRWLAGNIAQRWLEAGLAPSEQRLREAAEEGLERPEYRPPIPNHGLGITDRSVLVSTEGEVWVRRWTAPEEPQRWDVVGPDGRSRIVAAPPEVQLHAIRGGSVWGIVHSELDVPTIVRYSIEKIVREESQS